jgi:negative regulator of flagellin synthesis FlgM
MSIPTINNSTTPADGRSPIRQSGTQSGAGNGVGESNSGSQGKTTSGQTDAVSISARASDLKTLENNIKSLPDVDASRVSELREKINAGQYQIDSSRVADKILAFERNL